MPKNVNEWLVNIVARQLALSRPHLPICPHNPSHSFRLPHIFEKEWHLYFRICTMSWCQESFAVKILVAEDEPKTGVYLKKGLTEAGFVVDLVTNGIDAVQQAQHEQYDLLVLDVMMPGLDGWQVLERVRSVDSEIPALFLTARDRVEDRVKGLELGADDYLIKPFAFSELLARVRSLLRRGNGTTVLTTMAIEDLQLDLLKRRVERGGRRIDLTAKEFMLLELLLRRRGEVLSKSLIASKVWDINFDSDTNIIEVAIRRLRAKIDDDFSVKLIQTVRGMGYFIDGTEQD